MCVCVCVCVRERERERERSEVGAGNVTQHDRGVDWERRQKIEFSSGQETKTDKVNKHLIFLFPKSKLL